MTHEEWVDATLTRIGDEVQRARKAAGLKQEELAKEVGITRNALQNLESPKDRRSTFDVLTLMLIARRLGLAPAELLFSGLADGPVEVWPGAIATSFEAVQWFSGEISAADVKDGEANRSERIELTRRRARLKNNLREAGLHYVNAQATSRDALMTKEQAAQLVSSTLSALRKVETRMRELGLTVNDD
jgi:transcriptional regulator with XRE-family HTH domain